MEFWKHSLAGAFISRYLAKKVLSDSDDWEASFPARLMRDVGILVFDNITPEEYYKFLSLKGLSSTDQPLEELEKDHFKIDHSEACVMFMGKWSTIYDKVGSASLKHCKSDPNQSKTVNLYQLISTANRIVNHDGITFPVMTAFEESPEEGYLANLGISQDEDSYWMANLE